MRSWSVAARGVQPVVVQATNWVVALGLGLEKITTVADLQRLACEVLPNGTVIARDIGSGQRYVVQSDVSTGDVLGSDPESLEIEGEPERAPIADATDEVDACDALLSAIRQQIPAECGSVILDEGGYLRFVASFGPGASVLSGAKLPLGSGVAGYSMSKARSMILSDVREDPRHHPEIDQLTGLQTRDLLCMPIVGKTGVHGVVELMNLPEGRRFSRADVHALFTLTRILAERLDRG